MSLHSTLALAIEALKTGDVIAYPTEAVYGLGCDPMNEAAVHRVLSLKQRRPDKGLILIAASIEQLAHYVVPLSEEMRARILPTWPGPVTWLLPATEHTPRWICGAHETVAVRVTAHPVAKALCAGFGGAIVSTSANLAGLLPAKTAGEVRAVFGEAVYVVEGEVGRLSGPTEIREGATGNVVRGVAGSDV